MRLVGSDMRSMVGELRTLPAVPAGLRARHAVDRTPVSSTHAARCRVRAGPRKAAARAATRPGARKEARMVRLPDAAEQVKNAPVKALRGFFAGIGQLLLAADRFHAQETERERAAEGEHHYPLTTPDG